jgi:hypothetical protein
VFVNPPGKIRMCAQRIADSPGDARLAAKPARHLRLLAERFGFAVERLEQTGREQFHPAQQAIRFMRGECGERGHHGCAVDKRKPFLALQHDGFETGFLQRLGGREAFAVKARMTRSDEQPGHVRQRHKIAARSDGTFAGNFGEHPAI